MKRMMIAALTLCLSGSAMAQTYQDTSLPAAVRAKAMVKELTLDEKISLMMNESPAIPRLGIKAYEWWNEALHGVGRSGQATVFPQCIGMAASFDDGLLNRVYTAVSDEARAKNNQYKQAGLTKRYQGLTFWTPNVNIFRDPRWGRGQETYGEDPYLTSMMGVAVVKGLQGPADSKYDKAHACAKHFAVHSGPEWNRHSFDAAQIAPRDLWETYMSAFKSLVQKANVKEVMCAYNRFEGEPCCDNNRLLQQILRNEWGYQGIVVSDCWAINDIFTPGHHATEPDSAHASSKAVYAGTDLECGGSYASLRQAVEQGLISEERINQSVERLLTARYELGEMDGKTEWDKIPASVVDCQQHRDLALKMAKESIVLLKNGKIEEWKNGSILPLSKHLKVALMGPNMNDSVMQWGNYNGFPSHTTTLEAALRQRLTPDQLIVEPGCGHTSATRLESLFDKCSIDGQPGFRASYWNQMRPAGAPVTTVQVKEPFHFTTLGATVFAPGVNLSNFSGMYQTTFTPDKSETISFAFDTDGYCLLTVDGKEILRGGHLTSTHAATLQVEAGKSYDIRLIYAATNESVKLNFDLGRELPQNLAENVARVKDADVVIFAGGITPDLEGEEKPVSEEGFKGGDRTRIELPAIQLELLRQLKAAGKHIIFVNYSGSALALTEVDELCDAIVQAWYPGQAGGEAVAQVLFGEYNPAGRLPVTFYKSTEQLPDFEDYSMKGRTYRYMTEQPLYPFGYGLSYTSFKYGKARLSSKSMKAGHETTLSIPITNIGKQDGEEVVQVYVSRPDDTEGPVRALRAFRRVAIPKGQTVTVEIPLNAESLEWFDPQTNTMRAIPGTYELHYGGSSSLSDLQELAITFKQDSGKAVFSEFTYEGRDAYYEQHPLTSEDQTYNPILPGWYSDPSVCRDDKGDYWLVTSTFGAYPGVPLFHSCDLMNWRQVGSILTRPEQLPLEGQDYGMNGIYAASIFYNKHNQTYYMITTNVGLFAQKRLGNFVVKAKDPRGPWSDPIYLKNLKGIDPSLFFDDDGRAYVVYAQMHNREYPGHNSIIMHEYDVENDSVKIETERVIAEKNVWADGHKPYCIEGPHLYKINGQYYLMCAEGGTELNHAEIIFRSDNVWGEYKSWEGNPILTQRDLGERKDGVYCAGHADIFQDNDGRWWSMFLGTRRIDGKLENLGRETFLMPLKWTNDGWPYITRPDEEVSLIVTIPGTKRSSVSSWEHPEVEGFAGGNFTVRETFDSPVLADYWHTIRGAATDNYSLTEQPGNLVLKCIERNASDRSGSPAFVGRRLQHHHFYATTHLSFAPKGQERAGLLLFKGDQNQYFLAMGQRDGQHVLNVLKIGEGGAAENLASKPIGTTTDLWLHVSSETGYTFTFSYSTYEGQTWQTVADRVDADYTATQVQGTSNGFTGTLVGMYAVGH